jgi:VanZ family protein
LARERLPSQRRDRPGLAPGSLTVRRLDRARAYHPPVPPPGSTTAARAAPEAPRPATASLSRRLAPWLPVVAWAAVIFAFSAIPSLSTGLGTWDLLLRKLAHAAEFAVLGALLLRALAGRTAAAFALGVAYAVTDEIHQHFVAGRTAAPLDVAVDALGVLIGIALYRRWRS